MLYYYLFCTAFLISILTWNKLHTKKYGFVPATVIDTRLGHVFSCI